MAVYTDLTDEELSDLMKRYDIGAPLTIKGIAEGVENSNFFLETEAGRFILTIFEKRVNAADLPFFMGVLEAVANAGLPAAKPIRGSNGSMIQQVRGKPCSIVSFLPGVSAKRPNAAQCRAVGAALAGLHNTLTNHAGQRANSLGPADWKRLFSAEIAQAAEALEPNLHALVDSDLVAIAENWPKNLPTGIIHADLFPDNVLFLRNEVSGLIDFYFACTDILAYDLAVMLNAWCFEPSGREFDLIKGRSLISGYESIRPLSTAETVAIPILARGAALRFFLTRLIDWNATPAGALVRPKDPRDYSARLAFHRNAKTIGDYGG